MTHDPNAVDAYAKHLTDVNQTRPVVASENIYNSNGLLLVKQGQPISAGTVERIVRFKLMKPLERSVAVSGALTAQSIVTDIEAALKEPSAQRIHGLYDLGRDLKRALSQLHHFPVITQKLTVMLLQLPFEYRKTMWGVWLGLLVARKLGLAERQRDELVLAALARDIGLLHIDREIVASTGALTPEQWRTKQSHVLIGQLILREMEDMCEAVVRAVFEHHEVCDGSGFLTGATTQKLSLIGQIIGVVDAMTTILFKLKARGRWVRDLLPILRVNSYVHHPDVCAALILIIRELNLSEAPLTTDTDIDALTGSIMNDRSIFSAHASKLSSLVERLPRSDHRAVIAANRVNLQIGNILRTTGVCEQGYVEWLRAVAAKREQTFYRDIEDTRLMLDELRWQMNKLRRLLIDATHELKSESGVAWTSFQADVNEVPFLADAA